MIIRLEDKAIQTLRAPLTFSKVKQLLHSNPPAARCQHMCGLSIQMLLDELSKLVLTGTSSLCKPGPANFAFALHGVIETVAFGK
jgi:hypothetical protein